MRSPWLTFCTLVATATFSAHVWAGDFPSPDNASVDQQVVNVLLGDDVITGGWATNAPIPTPNGTSQTTTASDCFGQVYVIGGGTGAGPDVTLNLLMRYTPGDGWMQMANIPTPLRAFGAVTAVDANETFLIFGGFNGSAPINTLNIYNAMTNTWSTGAPIPASGGGFGVGVCQVDGRIFLAGGSTSFTSAFEYHRDTNTYTTIAMMSGGGAYRTHCSGVDAPISECHCFANGFDGRDHNVYHVNTNTWTVGTLMPIGVTDPAVATIGTKIYVMGGPVPGINGYTQIFDAVAGTWTTNNPRLPSSLNNTSGTINIGVSPPTLYVEGGYDGNGSVPYNYSYAPADDDGGGDPVTN